MQTFPMIFSFMRCFSVLLQHAQRVVTLCALLFFLPAANAELALEATKACNDKQKQVSVHCGSTPTAIFDDNGKLWVVFEQDQHVYVSHSSDFGSSYSKAIKVNPVAEDIEHNGENRPKIIAKGSKLLISWTLKTSPRYTGEIRFSRSVNSGESFSAPVTINDDGLMAGHRFESMHLTDSGQLYLAWIDKRDLVEHQKLDKSYPGAAIYYAVSSDYGESFSKNFRVSNNSCECCRIAMADSGDDDVAILWRQIFNSEIRDHAFAILEPEGEVKSMFRATVDDWYINACPHHGPAMTPSVDGESYHISWFSNGNINSGLSYSRIDASTGQSQYNRLVDGNPGSGHPTLLESNEGLFLLWKGFNGESTQLHQQKSQDQGLNWDSKKTVLETQLASDYPFLIKNQTQLFLAWHTQEFGYVVEEISSEN